MIAFDINRGTAGYPASNLVARAAIPLLGLVNLGISGYLTYMHYALASPICLFNLECDEVLTSPYTAIWEMPLALLGLVMYFVLTVLGLLLWRKESKWEHLIVLGTYSLALGGLIFTGYLYYLEIFVLQAFCSWCVASSIVLAAIFGFSTANFISTRRRLEHNPHARRFKISDYVEW